MCGYYTMLGGCDICPADKLCSSSDDTMLVGIQLTIISERWIKTTKEEQYE